MFQFVALINKEIVAEFVRIHLLHNQAHAAHHVLAPRVITGGVSGISVDVTVAHTMRDVIRQIRAVEINGAWIADSIAHTTCVDNKDEEPRSNHNQD